MSTLPDGYTVTKAVLLDTKRKVYGLPSDPNLRDRDNFGDSYIPNAAIEDMEPPREQPSKQAYYKPTSENAAKGKALINFLMQDKFFLALYRSNDPRVRAAAIDELNKAHHQAYGDVPIKDVDTTSVPSVTLAIPSASE